MFYALLAVVAVGAFIVGLRVCSKPRGCLLVGAFPLASFVIILVLILTAERGDPLDTVALFVGPSVSAFVATVAALLGRAARAMRE